MLRALAALPRHAACPVIGVNFGRVGFLAVDRAGRARATASRASSPASTRRRAADARGRASTASSASPSTTSSSRAPTLGRMVELAWAVGGEDLGASPVRRHDLLDAVRLDRVQPLERRPGARVGLDAMAITFVAPHSLHARPLVVPRGLDADVRNATPTSARGARRRPPRSATSSRTGRVDPPRRAAEPARDAAGDDVLPPLPRDLRLVAPDAAEVDGRRQGRAVYASAPMLRRLRIENLVLIREAELELAPGPERDHRRDRRGQDDPRAGGRAPARREGRRRVRRAGRRRGVRRGRARPAATSSTELGASCGPRTRTALLARAARLRATGARAPTRGDAPRRARTSPAAVERADRDVRPVRAAPARAAVVPARRARPLLRRRAARRRAEARAAWRELLAARDAATRS